MSLSVTPSLRSMQKSHFSDRGSLPCRTISLLFCYSNANLQLQYQPTTLTYSHITTIQLLTKCSYTYIDKSHDPECVGHIGGDDALCVEVVVVGYVVQRGCPLTCQVAAEVMEVSGGVGCHVPPQNTTPLRQEWVCYQGTDQRSQPYEEMQDLGRRQGGMGEKERKMEGGMVGEGEKMTTCSLNHLCIICDQNTPDPHYFLLPPIPSSCLSLTCRKMAESFW